MSVRLRLSRIAVSSLVLLLLLLFQLASAQQDPAACSVSCRFVVVPTLGPQGLPGLDGTPGKTGANGQPGEKGAKGEMGPQGPPGIDGINGINAINGTNGKDGQDGQDGLNGIDGINGINGTDGKDGADATFDSSAIYTGLQLEAPVLTGRISITDASLSGNTAIGTGATLTSPVIADAQLTGATTIAAGATITAPKVSTAEFSGISSFTSGASLASPTITGAELTGATKIATGSQINAPTITGAKLAGSTTFEAGAELASPRISVATLTGTIGATGTTTLTGTIGATGTTITDATFSGATLTGTITATTATITGVTLNNAKIRLSSGLATKSWDDVNAEAAIPGAPARSIATGTDLLNFYETIDMTILMKGAYLVTPRWVQVSLVRIGRLVTMKIPEFLVNGGARASDTISSHAASKMPARFAPPGSLYFTVPILDESEKLGTLLVNADSIVVYGGVVNTAFSVVYAGALGGIRATSVQWLTALA